MFGSRKDDSNLWSSSASVNTFDNESSSNLSRNQTVELDMIWLITDRRVLTSTI